MKRFYLICLLSASAIFSSCFSSMCVRVHSFDMAKMKSSPEYTNIKNEQELKNYNTLLTGGYFSALDSNIFQHIEKYLSDDTLFDQKQLSKTLGKIRPKVDSVVDG